MIQRCFARTLAAVALLGLAAGAVVLAQAPVRHYYTELYRYPQGGFPISADLDLTFRPDGSIVGYYRPTDGGLRPVIGSISGTRLSLTIGGVGGLQINGTMKGGKIEGRAFRSFGRELYSFVGRPIPHDGALPHER